MLFSYEVRADRDSSGVILDEQVLAPFRSLRLLARCWLVVEVDDSCYESDAPRTRN